MPCRLPPLAEHARPDNCVSTASCCDSATPQIGDHRSAKRACLCCLRSRATIRSEQARDRVGVLPVSPRPEGAVPAADCVRLWKTLGQKDLARPDLANTPNKIGTAA